MPIHKKYVFVDGQWEKLYASGGSGEGGGGSEYFAGDNITIDSHNVISATDTTYTAGDGIEITNTNVINNLIDISNYYNKTEIQDLLNAMGNLRMQIVETLPAAGQSNVIYLVKRSGINIYDQWIYQNYAWANIGDTSVDLTQYYTKNQTNAKLEEYYTKTETYSKTEVNNLKQDKLSTGSSITLGDSTKLSQVDLGNKLVNAATLQDIYTYIKTKAVTNWATDFLNKVYPVGSIYIAVDETNPATLFGGTWSQITNRFLLGSGTRAAGATGGSEETTIKRSDLPQETITTSESGSHRHNTQGYWGVSSGSSHHALARENVAGDPSESNNPIRSAGSHTHYFYLNGDVTQTKLNNLPPYLTVAIWKRTA